MSCIAPVKILDPDRPKADRVFISVPCGGCVGCRMSRARDWALRGCLELPFHEQASFLTLTYDDDHLPSNNGLLPSLMPPHLTDFFKRLRKCLKKCKYPKVKFLLAGEYGSLTGRPHYHVILFGCDFRDPLLRHNGLFNVYGPNPTNPKYDSSSVLNSLWGFGDCAIASVTSSSIAYVMQYTLKKVLGPRAKEVYRELGQFPEFVRMSRGIGERYVKKFFTDFSSSDLIMLDGKPYKPPRYFLQKLKSLDRSAYDALIDSRKEYIRTQSASAAPRIRQAKKANYLNSVSKRGL